MLRSKNQGTFHTPSYIGVLNILTFIPFVQNQFNIDIYISCSNKTDLSKQRSCQDIHQLEWNKQNWLELDIGIGPSGTFDMKPKGVSNNISFWQCFSRFLSVSTHFHQLRVMHHGRKTRYGQYSLGKSFNLIWP